MAAKHLILVHGRDIKPAASKMENLAIRALARGLDRAGHAATATALRNGDIRFSLVYYGDINNEIEAGYSAKQKARLTATNDPGFSFRKCFPIEPLLDAYAKSDAVGRFTLAAYRKVLDEADDWRLLDEAADAASLFVSLLTFGLLNQFLISTVKSDLTAYLTSQVVGSAIRKRLQDRLQPAIEAGDDICLVTHSLGCMVAYDLFWKFSFYSEYKHIRDLKRPIPLWLTIGCPLGELGVRRNLLDAMALSSEKFPRNQFLDWRNIYAEDDYIAHAESMRRVFGAMASDRNKFCRSIKDKKIYNCWHYEEVPSGRLVSNPHDLYGYLMNQDTAEFVGEWA